MKDDLAPLSLFSAAKLMPLKELLGLRVVVDNL